MSMLDHIVHYKYIHFHYALISLKHATSDFKSQCILFGIGTFMSKTPRYRSCRYNKNLLHVRLREMVQRSSSPCVNFDKFAKKVHFVSRRSIMFTAWILLLPISYICLLVQLNIITLPPCLFIINHPFSFNCIT